MKQIRTAQQHMDAASYRTAPIRVLPVPHALRATHARNSLRRCGLGDGSGPTSGSLRLWTRITASSSGRRRHQEGYIGVGSGRPLSVDEMVDRVAAFQEVSQEVGAKVRDVARRCLYSGPGASGLSRQDHRREPDNPVLLEVRQTDVAGLRAIEHDEDVRSEQGNKEDWKNDKMVRGCALRQSVRVPHRS
jgi:hypothetical protein